MLGTGSEWAWPCCQACCRADMGCEGRLIHNQVGVTVIIDPSDDDLSVLEVWWEGEEEDTTSQLTLTNSMDTSVSWISWMTSPTQLIAHKATPLNLSWRTTFL